MKKFGIFHKAFIYTTLFLFAVVAIAIGLFYQQFMAFYTAQQAQQLRMDYQALYEELLGANMDRQQMIDIAQRFSEGNQSFVFQIIDDGDNMLFFTANARQPDRGEGGGTRILLSLNNYTLVAHNPAVQIGGSFWLTAGLGFAAIMVIALVGAAVFARQMTNPIKRLAADTQKMTKLLPIQPPQKRNDEIGDLAQDVHDMYGKLKDNIAAQKYFFSAASHELKTPVAAARVVLEGMLAGVGDYSNHPKYLNQCIKLMDEQSKTICEILHIVNLDGHYEPQPVQVNMKEIVTEQLPTQLVSGQEVTIDLPEDMYCYADPSLLKKALSNVLLNAIQNTPQDGRIQIFAESNRLNILNTGHIDEAQLPHLFDPFYRLDKARNRKSGQTGLGLTIVKKTLDLMDVAFDLENTDGGVLFWMELTDISHV